MFLFLEFLSQDLSLFCPRFTSSYGSTVFCQSLFRCFQRSLVPFFLFHHRERCTIYRYVIQDKFSSIVTVLRLVPINLSEPVALGKNFGLLLSEKPLDFLKRVCRRSVDEDGFTDPK